MVPIQREQSVRVKRVQEFLMPEGERAHMYGVGFNIIEDAGEVLKAHEVRWPAAGIMLTVYDCYVVLTRDEVHNLIDELALAAADA
jgi:hypothetical protein